MKHYAGIDVSLNSSSVCVVDESGKIVRELKVASEPVALIHCLKSLGVRVERIALEAGPLSQWLYGALRESPYVTTLPPSKCWLRHACAGNGARGQNSCESKRLGRIPAAKWVSCQAKTIANQATCRRPMRRGG
jgi:hypothetical protein